MNEKNTGIYLLLTWPCSVVQFSCVLLSVGYPVPLSNTLFLSHLWEYHHKSYSAKKEVFGYIFCHRHYGSNFSYCDVISQMYLISKIMQTKAHYAVQRQLSDLLCVSNTPGSSLPCILHSFGNMV